jgi:hypothetical protein
LLLAFQQFRDEFSSSCTLRMRLGPTAVYSNHLPFVPCVKATIAESAMTNMLQKRQIMLWHIRIFAACFRSGFLSCGGIDDSRQCPFRLHYINLTKGKTYAFRIESTEFDSRLAIEDAHGKVQATDTDCMEEDTFGCMVPPTDDGPLPARGNVAAAVARGVLSGRHARTARRDASRGGTADP